MVKINPITGYSPFEQVHYDLLSAPKSDLGFSFTRWAFKYIHDYEDMDWKWKVGNNMFNRGDFEKPIPFLKQVLQFLVTRVVAATMPIFAFLDILQTIGKAIYNLCKYNLHQAHQNLIVCGKLCGIFGASIPLLPLAMSSPARVYLSDERWKMTSKANLFLLSLGTEFKAFQESNYNGLTTTKLVERIGLKAEETIGMMSNFIKREHFSRATNILSKLKVILLNHKTDPLFAHAKLAIDLTKSSYDLWSPSLTLRTSRSKSAKKLLKASKVHATKLNLCSFFYPFPTLVGTLPPEIGQLSQLEELELSCNMLKTLPNDISKLRELNKLNLKFNKLDTIPKEILSLSKLETLSLASNNLLALPSEIGQLSQLKNLYLGNNKLQILPIEIGQLYQLKKLYLFFNNLQTLPSEIGQLSQLKKLDLSHNKELKTLPHQIGQLSQLKKLYLFFNNLQTLPSEIGQLSQLKKLDLSHNKELKTLPPQIGQLSQLTKLELQCNNLQTLPSEIGQLSQLKKLDLRHNKKLKDLPLSLGQIPELITIDIEGTGIPTAMRDAILNQCQALREEKALEILPTRLHSWKMKSKIEVDLSGVNQFDEKQKKTINEWMVRLENTKDFNSKFQSVLAETVCRMLEDCSKNQEFRELFFVQVESNLECCEDRIAMALNEIYTTWKLTQLNDQAPLNEKLEMMWRGAKTLALRAAIAAKIDEHQKQTKKVEEEAVEIYLYYEILLSKTLNLLSIVNKMAYETIGKRDWIKEADLIETVDPTSVDHLIQLPNFETMAKNDKAYLKEYKAHVEPLDAKMDALLDNVPQTADLLSEVYLNWQSQVGELNGQRKGVIAQIKKQWAKEKLSV